MKKKQSEPINVILDEFVKFKNSQRYKGKQITSGSSYKSFKSVFNNVDAFKNCKNKEASRKFLDLLPKLLINKNYSKRLEELIKDIQENVVNNNGLNKIRNGAPNSYLKQFLSFVKKQKTSLSSKLTIYNSQLKITPKDKALIEENVDGELYTYNVLKTKFKGRLRSQDRTSGDKIWLPLRFIAKLYNEHVKEEKKKNKTVPNLFLNWLNELVNSIYIHYDNNGEICHVQFNNDVSLLFKRNAEDKNLFDVFVKVMNNNVFDWYPVLTPTGEGNKKESMQVTGINSIAIDHVIPIDKTLRDLENKLDELKIISDAYKELHEKDNPEEAMDEILQFLLGNLKWKKLKDELALIGRHGPLRLMNSNLNTQKSNGETFKEIYKTNNEEYWGILEEYIYCEGAEEPGMILCQKLVKTIADSGKIRVFPKDKIMGEGKSTNVTMDYDFKEYIDFI